MTTLKQLIEQHCPDGVEYQNVRTLFQVSNGKGINRSEYQEHGLYPVVDQGQNFISAWTDTGTNLLTEPPYIVFGDHSRERKWIPFNFVPGADGTKLLKASQDEDNLKYLFHALSDLEIPSRGYNRHWSIVRELAIPIPPREVQDKIVEYLDTFAALCENLDTEIAQREQQFAAYREKLLSVDYLTTRHGSKGVDYVQLGDTSLSNIGGGTPRRDNPDFWEGDIPWASVGDLTAAGHTLTACRQQITEAGLQGSSSKMVDTGTLLIATRMSPGLAKLTEIPVAINQDIRALTFEDSINPKFVSYVLQETRFETNGTIVKSITSKQINEATIPFPPREVQDEVVAKLDAMQELIDNLRLERKQRQQQLDYYRERLLSFPKKNTAEV